MAQAIADNRSLRALVVMLEEQVRVLHARHVV